MRLVLLAVLFVLAAPATTSAKGELASGAWDLPKPRIAATYEQCFTDVTPVRCITVEWCYIADRAGRLECEPRPRIQRAKRIQVKYRGVTNNLALMSGTVDDTNRGPASNAPPVAR